MQCARISRFSIKATHAVNGEIQQTQKGCFPFTANYSIESHTAPNAFMFGRMFILQTCICHGTAVDTCGGSESAVLYDHREL